MQVAEKQYKNMLFDLANRDAITGAWGLAETKSPMVSIPFLCSALQSGVPDAGDLTALL